MVCSRTDHHPPLGNVRKTKSKLIRLHYSIPGSVPDGTEFRITLMVEGGNVKVRFGLRGESLILF